MYAAMFVTMWLYFGVRSRAPVIAEDEGSEQLLKKWLA